MPPIRSNTNPTGLGTIDDYVERTSTLIFDFAGKTSAAKRVFNVIVRRTYNPLLGIRSNWFGRAASEKDPKGTSPTSYLGGLPSRRDPEALDPRAGAGGDAGVARSLRPAAVVVRLVAHARAPPSGRSARTTARRRMAGRESVVGDLFGTSAAARSAASRESLGAARTGGSEPVQLIGHTRRCRARVDADAVSPARKYV